MFASRTQREVAPDQLGSAAAAAMTDIDVVWTSGPGTAKHADVNKIAAMRAGLGDKGLLAIASGATPENIDTYLPHADAFLVGTTSNVALACTTWKRPVSFSRN